MNSKLKQVGIMPNFVIVQFLKELKDNPQLWNQYRERTCNDSPHREVDDIWLRYNDIAKLNPENAAAFTDEHFAVWYPAAKHFYYLKDMVLDLMCEHRATYLGGILITRIPPGKQVYPHIDSGWHVNYMNCKLYVILQSNNMCVNIVEEQTASPKAKEVWMFDNRRMHSVINMGNTDRITLIVCLHVDEN